MQLSLTPSEKKLFDLIGVCARELGQPAYIIGGYVRDKVMGRNSTDIDIVSVGSGIELAKAVAAKFDPNIEVVVFKNFGTAKLKPGSGELSKFDIEFVGARKESYRASSRNPIVEDGTFEEDLNRRDFTINMLGMSLNKEDFGKLIDTQDGIKDIKAGIIRTPLEADQTFSDDPLRMMRAIRFAAQFQFQIESETLSAISRNKDRISIVAMERITDELNKIILAPLPSVGFELLFDSGLLELILPELCALQGAEVRNKIGHKDNFYHTLQVLDNLSAKTDDLWLRWAAILHDIAKPQTKKFDPKHGWTFHGHEYLGSKMVSRIFGQLKLPLNDKMKFVEKMVLLHLRPIPLVSEKVTDSGVRRLLFDAGDDIDALMLLCEADITSKDKGKVELYLKNFKLVRQKIKEVEERDRIRNWEPPIDGELIMKTFDIPPSEKVGILKKEIKNAILDGDIDNDYEAAFKYLIKRAKKLGLEPIKRK